MNSSRDDLVPEGGMYARVPIPAVKALVYSGNRAAARVLMALCLHLGKNSRVVWPGYPTIALFAYVSENNIRKILNTLISMGYVSVEKKWKTFSELLLHTASSVCSTKNQKA